MTNRTDLAFAPSPTRAHLIARTLAAVAVLAPTSSAQNPVADCSVDLARAGQMKDVVSNALMLGLERPEAAVKEFLVDAEKVYADGPALLKAAASHFKLAEADLATTVERYRHINCGHPIGPLRAGQTAQSSIATTPFAENVTVHVVLHELGHALVREFDLPVLGNEETLADAFATHYLTAHMPERAFAVLQARVQSLMTEAAEVPRAEWDVSGEHNSDARRAHQITALAIAADPDKYAALAQVVGMSEGDVRSAKDYGTEIHRSWRRLLAPLWLPADAPVREARVKFDSNDGLLAQLRTSDALSDMTRALKRFDWHSQVTLRFAVGDGGAGWNRSKRTITVHSGYIERFVRQGANWAPVAPPKD